MKKLLYVLTVCLVFLITINTSFGQVSSHGIRDKINAVSEGNIEEDEISQFLIKHLGNEQIIINFLEDNKSLSIMMEDGKVVNIAEEKINGTVELNFRNMKVFEGLTNREIGFKQAFKDKDISFRGLTLWNKIRLGFLNLILHVGLSLI